LPRSDVNTGVPNWDIQTSCMRFYATSVLLTNTHLYVMTNMGLVECRLRANGSFVWNFQTGSWGMGNLSLGDQLYCTSDDRCIHKLDLLTGSQIWLHCFTGNFAAAAPFTAGDDLRLGLHGRLLGVDSAGNTGIQLQPRGIIPSPTGPKPTGCFM